MKPEDIKKHNEFRHICLKNAEELLDGASAMLEKKLDHIAFHLSVLALEEIGKVELMGVRLMAAKHPSDREMNLDIDDHEKKLFFAIWGQSFGKQKISQKQIDDQRGLAKNLHERRMDYFYANPDDMLSWRDKMKEGEAKMIHGFVEARLKLEQAEGDVSEEVAGPDDPNLQWFFKAVDDPQKRKEIWSPASQQKLIELGDVKKWIPWLREVYEQNEGAMRELLQKEMTRQKPSDEEAWKPKWRVRVKIKTPSHSIRNKALNELNAQSSMLKLKQSDKNTLIIELTLPKKVPVQGLWDYSYGYCRMFVAALNIATRGLFWWNVPVDISRFYDEIWDLESNAGVRLELNPRLQLDWKSMRLVLGSTELSLTGLVFQYISHLWMEKHAEAIDLYVSGISLLAKNDVHLRLELNAFEQFYKALKTALQMNGHWDGKSDLKKAAHEQLTLFYGDQTANVDAMLDLGAELEAKHATIKPITLTEVIAMKAYCDAYLIKLAKEFEENRSGTKIEIVLGSDPTPAPPRSGDKS
ncbi:MAG: AbiV family abortive infection protein [Patescibacteria group bacterium]|nr:AbiV family abortive infection protein [Patescibacteria group bacterium]